MKYGYCRVSTKGQLEGNSIEDQANSIKEYYPDAKIVLETYSAAKQRPIFDKLLDDLEHNDIMLVT